MLCDALEIGHDRYSAPFVTVKVDDDHVRLYGYRGILGKLLTFFSSDGHCPVAFDCRETTRPFTLLPTTSTKLTLAHPTRSLASDSRLMSAQEPVIAVSNETSESQHVDSPAVLPSEHLVVKETPNVVDSSPAEPVTELQAEVAQTTSDDTPATLHDTNIPDATPTYLNGSVDGVEITPPVCVELLNFFCLSPFRLRGSYLRPIDTGLT